MPAGFPPFPHYSLLADQITNGAPRGVAYQRTVLPTVPDWGDVCRIEWVSEPQNAYRVWLRANGGRRTLAACAPRAELTHRWRSTSALRCVVQKEQRDVELLFAAMVRELAAAKVLLRADAKVAQANVRLVIDDQRGNRKQALPDAGSLLGKRRPATRPAE